LSFQESSETLESQSMKERQQRLSNDESIAE